MLRAGTATPHGRHRRFASQGPDLLRPPGLDDDRIPFAVYALRCAFAHDYGLNHMGLRQARREDEAHVHAARRRRCTFIQLPSIRWNSDHQRLGYRGTEVNVRKLGDLAEHVDAALQRAPYPDGLSVALSGGVEELFERFAFQYYATP